MDIKVAFTSQALVPNPAGALEVARGLAERLHIAHRPAVFKPQYIELPHGFFPIPAATVAQLSPHHIAQQGLRQIRGEWYRTANGQLEQSPYYQWRLGQLEAGIEQSWCEIEAVGLRLALHPNMHSFDLLLITLHLEHQTIGPFTGQVFPEMDLFPSSEIEERTGLFGVLVHMQLVEFLAALRREAIPSLYIRDPSGYLEHGDVLELFTAFENAGFGYQSFLEALTIPQDATPDQTRQLKAFWRLPETEDKTLALPDLRGEVGSEGRIAAFEEFLFLSGVTPVDIDHLIAEGR